MLLQQTSFGTWRTGICMALHATSAKVSVTISLNTMTLQVESPTVYTCQGVPISVTGIAQVKIQGQNEEMLSTACEQFLGKSEDEIHNIALVTLEGHQRAIMGSMTVEEIYKDRKKFSKEVFEVASSDLVNMGITVVSYTLKDIRDEEGAKVCSNFTTIISNVLAHIAISSNIIIANSSDFGKWYFLFYSIFSLLFVIIAQLCALAILGSQSTHHCYLNLISRYF